MSSIFIAGIDTDVGKTYITGLLAKYLLLNNKSVITQKIVQTGFSDISKDIITHREIMGVSLSEYDKNKITCPYNFKYPASPHLSAELEKTEIDISKIENATKILETKFDNVIIEGVGGLMVPLNKKHTSLDYIKKNKLPVILVSSPELGSINHTLLSLEALKNKNIDLLGIVYNIYGNFPTEIKKDSINVFKDYLKKLSYPENIIEISDTSKYSDDEIKELFVKFKI